MKADALILAGGASRRMGGNHKGNLTFQGQTFQERIISELKKEAETVWISYGREKRGEHTDCPAVMDIYQDCGPIVGIHAGLSYCENELVMVSSCDLPYLKIELYQWLYGRLLREEGNGNHYEGIVSMSGERVHPLTAIYRKTAAVIALEQIQKGNYRLRDLAADPRILKVSVPDEMAFMLTNVNTIEEYKKIQKEIQ